MLVSISKLLFMITLVIAVGACASKKLSSNPENDSVASNSSYIDNPFSETGWSDDDASSNITLRSKNGDQSVEVMIPKKYDSDLEIPMGQVAGVKKADRRDGSVDYSYRDSKPTIADREIASTFNSVGSFEDEKRKREVEQSLGLQEIDALPSMDESYLAKIDIVKQLFRTQRFEAALIETDQMLKEYPTDAKLYEMRGTLLDRLGYKDLALRSWKQSLEFKPNQVALKKVVDKRELQRGVASEKMENR